MTERAFETGLEEEVSSRPGRAGRRVSLLGGTVLGTMALIGIGVVVSQRLLLAEADSTTARNGQRLEVQVARLESVDQYERRVAYTGTVRARRSTLVSFERPGRVTEVFVDEGARVEQGQVLAKLDSQKLDASRRELQAQIKHSKALLAEAQAGPRQQSVAQAEQRVNELEADAALAQLEFNRIAQLRRSDTSTQQELDRATFQVQATSARLETARLELDLLREGTRQEQIAAAIASVERLEAQLAELDLQIADCSLTAPFDGEVTRRLIDEGAIVAAGTAAIEIAETGHLEVWIGIPVDVGPNLQADAIVSLTLQGREYRARVDAQLAQLNAETRTRTVILELLNDSQLESFPPPLAELARLEVTFTEQASGFWVPLDAMTRGPRGLWTLLVAEPVEGSQHRVARINVEILHSQTDRAFVRGPLPADARLILSGAHRVTPGQLVTVSEPTASPQEQAEATQ